MTTEKIINKMERTAQKAWDDRANFIEAMHKKLDEIRLEPNEIPEKPDETKAEKQRAKEKALMRKKKELMDKALDTELGPTGHTRRVEEMLLRWLPRWAWPPPDIEYENTEETTCC